MNVPFEGIWSQPLVVEKNALVSPFFTTVPVPYLITERHIRYFFRALVELSQVIYYIAVNTPICGQKENHVLREFLIFHVEHFLNVSFRIPDFVRHLHPKNSDDKLATDFLRFLDVESEAFLADWNRGVVFGNCLSPPELRKVLKKVKGRADTITGYILAHNLSPEQFKYQSTVWERFNDFFSQYPLPSWCPYVWFVVGAGVALIISTSSWLIWRKNYVVCAVVITILSFFQFGLLLFTYYLFHRRSVLAEWYSRELTVNHSRTYFSVQKDLLSEKYDLSEVQFSVMRKRGVPQALSVKEKEMQNLITMIAFTKTLKVIVWNAAAQSLTQFKEEDVIGQSLRLLLDSTSIGAIKEFVQSQSTTAGLDGSRGLELLLMKMNTKSRDRVTVSGRVSIAFLDAEPVIFLCCTSSHAPQEGVSMKYLSNVGSALLLQKLKENSGQGRSVEIDLVRNHSWHALQMRASHSWREADIPRLIEQINQNNLPCRLVMHELRPIPPFECDVFHVVEALENIFSSISTPSPMDQITVRFSNMNLKHGCSVLSARIILPDKASFPPQERINKMVSIAGYIYAVSENRDWLECVFPIFFQTKNGKNVETTPSHSLRATPEPELDDILFSFIAYENDLHYSFLVNTFTSEHHRFVRVQSPKELQTELENNADKVSAVLISDRLVNFKDMVETVKRRHNDIYIALTKEASDGLEFPMEPFCLPTHVDYCLPLPIDEEGWKNFLHNVSLCQKERESITPFSSLEVIKILSRGNNTTVALVRDRQTGGTLVEKRIIVGATEQSVKEIRLMKSIGKHPHILQCISSKRISPTCFCIYYPYCSGGTFERRIKEGPFTLRQLIPFAFQLLSAVYHLHSKGVAHMDIKPSNLLLDDQDNLQLADFGSAVDEPPKDALRGKTPAYSAPERLLVMPDEGNRISVGRMHPLFSEDVWSVGLTLLEFLGAFPEVLHNKSLDGILEVYKSLYQENRSIPFRIPASSDTSDPSSGSLNEKAQNFFSSILQIKPSQRDTAEQLLRHPFLAGTR